MTDIQNEIYGVVLGHLTELETSLAKEQLIAHAQLVTLDVTALLDKAGYAKKSDTILRAQEGETSQQFQDRTKELSESVEPASDGDV